MENPSEAEPIDYPEESRQIIEHYRKSETRTAWSDIFVEITKKYITEVLQQEPATDLIERFKEMDGVVAFSGSILRGTAHAKSDIDMPVYYDSRLGQGFEKPSWDPLNLVGSHPSGKDLEKYFNQELTSNPSYLPALEQKRQIRDKEFPDLSTNDQLSLNDLEVAGVDISQFAVTIRRDEDLGVVFKKLIPVLLTLPLEFAVESSPGSLFRLQQQTVRELCQLNQENPERAKAIWNQINEAFSQILTYTAKKYPEYDAKLMRRYIEKSGRFAPEKVEHAVKLLGAIRQKRRLPSLDELAEAFGVSEK